MECKVFKSGWKKCYNHDESKTGPIKESPSDLVFNIRIHPDGFMRFKIQVDHLSRGG